MKTSKEMLKKIITLLKPKHAKLQDTKYKKIQKKYVLGKKSNVLMRPLIFLVWGI